MLDIKQLLKNLASGGRKPTGAAARGRVPDGTTENRVRVQRRE
jgi:hypothetical protein